MGHGKHQRNETHFRIDDIRSVDCEHMSKEPNCPTFQNRGHSYKQDTRYELIKIREHMVAEMSI